MQGVPPAPLPGAAPAAPAADDAAAERAVLQEEVYQAYRHLEYARKELTGDKTVYSSGHKQEDDTGPVRRHPAQQQQQQPAGYRARGGGGPNTAGFKIEFTTGYLNMIPELSVLFLSCLLPVLALSGKHVLTTLLAGMVATYSLDYMNHKKSALASVWLCVSAVWLGLYFSNTTLMLSSWLNAFIVLDVSLYLFCFGVFATVQFKWLQLQSPELALAAERMLLGLTPIVCLPLIFTGFVSFMGSQVAPLGLAAIMCSMHKGFYTLRKSAFKEALTPSAREEEYINGRTEAVAFTAATLILPGYLHIAINHRELLTALNLLTLFTLCSVPLMYLFAAPEKHLWFLYRRPYAEERFPKDDVLRLGQVRVGILFASYAVALHWVIYRIAFGRFAHLFAAVRPPFNVILIAIAAYCGSAVVYMGVDLVRSEQTGFGRGIRWTCILVAMVVAAVSFTYAAGMPQFVIACSALSAACLTSFCLEPKNLNNYLIFACTSFIMLTWWMYKSFSFLMMDLPVLGGSQHITLPQLSVYILWLFLIQAVIFPLGLNQGTAAFYLSLLQQVCALTAIEHILYSQPENMYPGICVLATSLWGLYFVRTLTNNKKISKTQGAVLTGLYVAKTYLFAMCATLPSPESELHDYDYGKHVLVATFVFVTSMAGIVSLLYFEQTERKRRSAHLGRSLANVVQSVLVAFFSRHSIVLALLELLTGEPPEVKLGRLWGLVILYAGILQLPLTLLVSHSRPSRICHGFLLTGAAIALLDPVLEGTGEDLETELELFEPPGWAGILGIASLAGVAATLLNAVTLPDTTAVRIAWWGVVSIGCGFSFTGMFIPYASFHTYLLISLVFVLLVLSIDFTHYNAAAQREDSNAVWGLYTGSLLTMLAALLDAQWRVPESFDRNLQYETANVRQNAILSLSIGLNILLAALIKFKQSDRPVLRPRSLARADALKENLGEGKHFGLLGNICIIQAYVSLLILRSDVGAAGPGFPVMASVLLLLMNDDDYVLFGINDPEQMCRYVPPLVASLLTLTYRVVRVELVGLFTRTPIAFAAQLTIFVLAFAVGCSATYDLWMDAKKRRSAQGSADMLLIGLCGVMFIFASTEAIRLTVVIALIACVAPAFNDSAWSKKLASIL